MPDGSDGVSRLADPRPADGAKVPGGWWPPVMLDIDWIRANRACFDVFHVHFGFDAKQPAELLAIAGTGYGAEDTDFGQLAQARAVELVWVGGAWAYHQHHATQRPPVQHLDDILRNAAIFHDRWGWWPMHGWLEQFEALGLARQDARTGRWKRIGVSSGDDDSGRLPHPARRHDVLRET
jgi:hypothetical protein